MKPTLHKPFLTNFPPDQKTILQYVSVLRHPTTGEYMLFYSTVDFRTRNEWNANLGNHMVRLLYSNDGISFIPLISTVLAGLESNILLYTGQDTHNFSPMVDTSDCPISATNTQVPRELFLDDSEVDTQEYLQGNLTFTFPRRYGHSFKAIVGTYQSDTNNNGLHSFRSADGINWKSYGDGYFRRAIADVSHVLSTPFTYTYFDSRNDLLYDHEENVFKIFARHNINRGIRGIQMLRSNSACEWQRYNKGSSIATKVHSALESPAIEYYTPSASVFPATRYIAFFPTSHFINHGTCPTFVSFMYSVDGGRSANHDVLSILYPERTSAHNIFRNCTLLKGTTPDVVYEEMDVRGVVESPDCRELYMYTMHSRTPRSSIIKIHKFRYGGLAAVQSDNWSGKEGVGGEIAFVDTRILQIPQRALRLILNYEVETGGYVKVGVSTVTAVGDSEACQSDENGDFVWSQTVHGNELAKEITWVSQETDEVGSFVSHLAGKRVILRFELSKARLYGFLFAHSMTTYKRKMKTRGNFCFHEFV